MIGLDAAGRYGSRSYWVQTMFSNNLGAHVIGSTLSTGSSLKEDVTATTSGGVTTYSVKIVNPYAIVPQASSVTVANGQRFAFPATSVTVLQITAK